MASSGPKIVKPTASPDQNAAGLLQSVLDPLRYDRDRSLDPDEVPGIVARMIPPGSRVLDVGCGTGALARVLAEECRAEVVGVEPDSVRAERAMARGLEVHVGYLTEELLHQIGPFSIVLFADVLEHLQSPQAMLLLSRLALRPRGAVIASVPNVAHWAVRVEIMLGRFRYQPCGIMDATHLRWFTAASAKSLFASAGFNVVQYRATAGIDVFENLYRAPLCWLSQNQRTSLLRMACRRWPTLFGSQHVVKAEMI